MNKTTTASYSILYFKVMANSTPIKEKFQSFWKELLSYFNVAEDLEPQLTAEQTIRSGVSFKGSQLLVLIFAIFIASLGLNTNSVPVIIGAMLISPLMGPIIGMGLGIGIEDYDLLKRGLKNIIMAIIGSLAASAIYFVISPQYEGSSQLLARTSPSIYDVFVALFGGGAGIVSICCRNKGQVMPGVAIATSLMPPLCTAGYGIATWQSHFFFGALYLFFTNMVFILFASLLGVKLMKYKKIIHQNRQRNRKIQNVVYTIVFATIGVSCYLTYGMIRKSIFMASAVHFVETEMVFPNTQVLNHSEYIDKGKRYIDVTLIGAALPKDSLQLAMLAKLDSVGLGGTVLNIKQGFSITRDEIDSEKNFDRFYSVMQQEIANRQEMIDSLKEAIRNRDSYADESVRVAPEVKVLFPTIKDIALSKIVASTIGDVEHRDTVNMVFVNAPGGLSEIDKKKLSDYIGVRLQEKAVHVAVNPSNFPWPSHHD
ncbi:MAG: TIGR00341 family protein [Muribaculaceae bacterium]|nr:TIGR00341 family protein [Muribaculaceae bacterium]